MQETETQPVLMQPIINGAFDPTWQLRWRAGIEWRSLVSAPLLGPGLEKPPEPTEVPPK